ncbi:MAG: response regulator transcription factor [Candidatus Cloacimonetes bacterium]|nr:response regulator transcription factor [Candidatus Cloacimonadota bacterium]
MKKIIAVVDDEPDILQLVELNLQKAGFEAVCFETGQGLLDYLKNNEPELIILDLMLPDYDGFDICKMIRRDDRTKHLPVIMFTAKGETMDKVVGLEIGADDYLDKMSSPRELVARVKAVLRRSKTKMETEVINLAGILQINPQKFLVSVNDQEVSLTTTEFKILHLLAQHPGWVYSRNQILDHLWGNDKIVIDRTIDVHIKNLREKLGPAGDLVKNIRGVGYKLDMEK